MNNSPTTPVDEGTLRVKNISEVDLTAVVRILATPPVREAVPTTAADPPVGKTSAPEDRTANTSSPGFLRLVHTHSVDYRVKIIRVIKPWVNLRGGAIVPAHPEVRRVGVKVKIESSSARTTIRSDIISGAV